MFNWILDYWHIRGRKIQTIRASQTRKVTREKNKEKKRELMELRQKAALEIKRRNDHITELRSLLRSEQARHIEEEKRIQKQADKRVMQKTTHLNKEYDRLDKERSLFEVEKSESLAEMNFLKTELKNSLAEAKTALAIYQQQARFNRQVAGVTSGLSDSLEVQIDKLDSVDQMMNTSIGQQRLKRIADKR